MACFQAQSQRELLTYVPASSYAVLAVNWKTVSKDTDLNKISKGVEVEKLFAQLGLPEGSVREFAVFSDPGSSGHMSSGLIVKGSFDSDDVVKELVKQGWTEQDFEGRRVYANPKDGSWLATFHKQILILGTESGVKDAIGAESRSEDRFTANPAYKVLAAHFEGKQYPILMMVALPPASQDMANAAVQLTSTVMNLTGIGPLGDLLNKIGYAQGLGCAISHRDDLFPVALLAVMKDEESAKLVSGALSLLTNLGGMVSKNYASRTDADATLALRTMMIERKREVVVIKMSLSKKDLAPMNH
jgi:hypothetical protein